MKRLTAITRPFTAAAGAPVRPAKAALNYLAVCVAVIAVVWASLAAAGISLNFDFVAQYRARIWDGFCMTVGISAASLVVSLVLGVLVAAGQGARFLPLRYLCDFYVKIIRGTPLIVQVYFFYYIIGTAWGIDNRVLAGVVILSLFSGAYIAEIVRGSLLSLDAGQMEAARAVGFTHVQTLRYVVAPQLVARCRRSPGRWPPSSKIRRCCRSSPSSSSPRPYARSPPRTTTSSAGFCCSARCIWCSRCPLWP